MAAGPAHGGGVDQRPEANATPDVLGGPNESVQSPEAWRSDVRPRWLSEMERTVYGRQLPAVPVAAVGAREVDDTVLPGGVRARRMQVRLRLGSGAKAPITDVVLYVPPDATGPVPVFLGLNFLGNQAECPDPGIRFPSCWLPNDTRFGIDDHRATDASRGMLSHRWPAAAMIRRGYGMATACCNDVFPDRPDGRAASCLASLGRPTAGELPSDEPGAVAAWAWQLSRILDWLVTRPEVAADKVAVIGFSRLGKAALWAGACDERFALVVSIESGCGGAALSKRPVGETVAAITRKFAYWFCPAFAGYAGREEELPIDQHCLLALVAPRPLYVASASDDTWADPEGEFLGCVAADPVWRLFGQRGLGTTVFPPPDTPVGDTVGYHVRSGRHELLPYDWQRCADFADRVLRGVAPPTPEPYAAFQPQQATLPAKPPTSAIVLVTAEGQVPTGPDGPALVAMGGGAIDWQTREGGLEVAATKDRMNHVVSATVFRDADIHAEFVTSPQGEGNSGLYLHGLYEMQILDSFGRWPPQMQDEGSLYRFSPPLVNAARPTGEWQVYDIRFIAPRRAAGGAITKPGSVTAWLNGRLVQEAVEITDPRSPYVPYRHGVTTYLRGVEGRLLETGAGPLILQDHGSPTRFRNVWIAPLEAVPEPVSRSGRAETGSGSRGPSP